MLLGATGVKALRKYVGEIEPRLTSISPTVYEQFFVQKCYEQQFSTYSLSL